MSGLLHKSIKRLRPLLIPYRLYETIQKGLTDEAILRLVVTINLVDLTLTAGIPVSQLAANRPAGFIVE
jgi:hypothetical protein